MIGQSILYDRLVITLHGIVEVISIHADALNKSIKPKLLSKPPDVLLTVPASVKLSGGGRRDTFIVCTMFGSVGTPEACRVGSSFQSVHISVEDICYDLRKRMSLLPILLCPVSYLTTSCLKCRHSIPNFVAQL